jgi:hypothetical protein
MQIKLTVGTTVIFDKDATLTEKQVQYLNKRLVYMTATPEEREAMHQQFRATWLAGLSEEKRAAFLAIEELSPDEQKLEFAKLQETTLQAQLAKVETTVATMTAAVAAKPIPKPAPIGKVIP